MIYEIVNKGKGLIAELTPDNLLLIEKDGGESDDIPRGGTLDNYPVFGAVELLIEAGKIFAYSNGRMALELFESADYGGVLLLRNTLNPFNTVTIRDGYILYNNNVKLYSDPTQRAVVVEIINASGMFPARGLTGAHDFSTAIQDLDYPQKIYVDKAFGTTNETEIALTESDLNSTYPDIKIGYRVRCPNIAGGSIIYEKSSETQWLAIEATIVT